MAEEVSSTEKVNLHNLIFTKQPPSKSLPIGGGLCVFSLPSSNSCISNERVCIFVENLFLGHMSKAQVVHYVI